MFKVYLQNRCIHMSRSNNKSKSKCGKFCGYAQDGSCDIFINAEEQGKNSIKASELSTMQQPLNIQAIHELMEF